MAHRTLRELYAEPSTEQALAELRAIKEPVERYLFLRRLKVAHLNVFFNLLFRNTHETLPYVYTPTVGEVCQRYHTLPLRTWGLYISLADRGSILQKLRGLSQQAVTTVVVTDGERILGLGDLGTGGMGISEGKIMLYTVAAGVDPNTCLPICLDVGTNNEALLADPLYPGLKQRRVTGDDYDAFVDELMAALREWRSHVLVQFEDFGNNHAFRLLAKHRPRACCFNDDIQGTACITLAGVLSALRATGAGIAAQRFLFMGAGEAGIGIGEIFALAIAREGGVPLVEARKRCFFMDSKGLVVKSRTNLQHHKIAFAQDCEPHATLLEAVEALRPTALIGVSTVPGAFSEPVCRAMARHNTRPIIFPLSNPTHLSECTFADAMAWTEGRALFASGSPFDPIEVSGTLRHPAQANNAYVFPAIGHAAILSRAKTVPDSAFLLAASEVAHVTSVQELEEGRLFPSFDDIRSVSKRVMVALCRHFEAEGLGSRPDGREWEEVVAAAMWTPSVHSKL